MINITDKINITDVAHSSEVLIIKYIYKYINRCLAGDTYFKNIKCVSDHVGFGMKLGPTLVEADLGRTLDDSTFSAEDGSRLFVGPL